MLGAFLKKGDVISGAVLAALGVYIITQARAWDYYTLDGPGPGFFPFWYGVAMVVLSLLLVLNAARTGDDGESKAGVDWPSTGRAPPQVAVGAGPPIRRGGAPGAVTHGSAPW